MRYALYRCLYGEDFIQESIKSIRDHVDRVFVFWTDKAWGNTDRATYKGEEILFPKKFDNIIDKIKELDDPKVELVYAHTDSPFNQFTYFVNEILLKNYDKPDTLIIPEVDHVFREDQIKRAIEVFESVEVPCASTRQVELWKQPNFKIPERYRLGTMFWNIKMVGSLPETGCHANPPQVPTMADVYVHNMGFCISKEVMKWKHLTAMAFSIIVGDSPPNEKWLEDKWEAWTEDNQLENLEISEGQEHFIPRAEPYDVRELPETIREKYGYE